MKNQTLLQRVRAKITRMDRPAMIDLASNAKVGIDTIRRIKLVDGYDPVSSRLQRLADALGVQ